MKLLTKALLRRFEALGRQDVPADQAIVPTKFFCPWSSWTWYPISYDPDTQVFFGYVEGFESELGTFSLEELEAIRGPGGLTIERDLYWPETMLNVVMGA